MHPIDIQMYTAACVSCLFWTVSRDSTFKRAAQLNDWDRACEACRLSRDGSDLHLFVISAQAHGPLTPNCYTVYDQMEQQQLYFITSDKGPTQKVHDYVIQYVNQISESASKQHVKRSVSATQNEWRLRSHVSCGPTLLFYNLLEVESNLNQC